MKNTTEKFKPVIIDGKQISGYWVDLNGNVWSTKGKEPKILKPSISGNTKYPKVGISINGVVKVYYVHRLCAAAWHEFPTPEGISQTDWNNTPESVKEMLTSLFQVNHIDHNHTNFHPSNLEWVTVKQNAKAYQQHRVTH